MNAARSPPFLRGSVLGFLQPRPTSRYRLCGGGWSSNGTHPVAPPSPASANPQGFERGKGSQIAVVDRFRPPLPRHGNIPCGPRKPGRSAARRSTMARFVSLQGRPQASHRGRLRALRARCPTSLKTLLDEIHHAEIRRGGGGGGGGGVGGGGAGISRAGFHFRASPGFHQVIACEKCRRRKAATSSPRSEWFSHIGQLNPFMLFAVFVGGTFPGATWADDRRDGQGRAGRAAGMVIVGCGGVDHRRVHCFRRHHGAETPTRFFRHGGEGLVRRLGGGGSYSGGQFEQAVRAIAAEGGGPLRRTGGALEAGRKTGSMGIGASAGHFFLRIAGGFGGFCRLTCWLRSSRRSKASGGHASARSARRKASGWCAACVGISRRGSALLRFFRQYGSGHRPQ